MNLSTPGLPVHHQLPEFTETHVHRVSDAIQPSPPLSSPSPPNPNPSQHQSLLSQLCMRWPKYWSLSFSTILSKEIPGLISFRMDWLDLLAVQGTLKSLNILFFLKCSLFDLMLCVSWTSSKRKPGYIWKSKLAYNLSSSDLMYCSFSKW